MVLDKLSDRLIFGFLVLYSIGLHAQSAGVANHNDPERSVKLAQDVIRDWPHVEFHSKAKLNLTNDEVAAFLNASGSSSYAAITPSDICQFTFQQIAGNGEYSLIVSVDPSGRFLCNDLIIASKGSPWRYVPSWGLTNQQSLNEIVVHEGSAQRPLLVVPKVWFATAGLSDCIATWTTIYKLFGTQVLDMSADHPEIYRRRLSVIETDLAKIAGKSETERSCLIAEGDRIKRRLGISQTAGLSTAERWAKDEDPKLRRNAAEVLSDIDDPRAQADLRALSDDTSKSVAQTAKLLTHERRDLSR